MSDKSYYQNLYKQKKKEVDSYDGNLKDLRKILSNLTDNMSDKIRAVNNELEDLKSDLNKGVRHNASFTTRASAVTAEKEKAVTADSLLSAAVRGLQEEISRVNNLRNQAASDRDYYYQQYKNAK